MFWRFGGYANISTLDSILDKPDVTVEELLDESDLIQELKQQNSKLIEYLRDENVLERLLRYVVAPKPSSTPSDDTAGDTGSRAEEDKTSEGFFGKAKRKSRSKSVSKSDAGDGEESKEEKQRLKYAYVACEILSCEVWSISEALLENVDSLRVFWQYIKQPPALDPVQAGYFTKVNDALLDRKTEEMLEFIRSVDNVVPDILQHVDCPTIMDLLLKIISLEKAEGGQGTVDWLQSQNLVPILLSYLSPEQCSSTQTSAGDFLKAIITISANATTQDQSVIGPNELTRQLVSENCVKSLIQDMLRGGNPLTVGVGIVIEVIRKNNSDYDLENQTGPVPKSSDPIYLGALLRQFANHITDFMDLVRNPNHTTVNSDGTTSTRRRELKAAFGGEIEPLGFDRFKTCELMAELLHCSNMALLNERGSESEVKKRDAERERLKAEGKLRAGPDSPSPHDFGTSVDSHGFHHARAPSSESPEEIKKLEIQNNVEEDEFEKVTSSEAIPDSLQDAKDFDDINEKLGEMIGQSPEASIDMPNPVQSREERPEELASHIEKQLNQGMTGKDLDEANEAQKKDDAESPTTVGLSAQVGGLDLDNDTEMSNARDERDPQPPDGRNAPRQPSDEPPVSLLTQQLNLTANSDVAPSPGGISPHPEDKPAPLFASKSSKPAQEEPQKPSAEEESQQVSGSETSEATTTGDENSSRSALPGGHGQDYSLPYEVDIDDTPVVGDLLKIRFVENKVVPTILDFFFRFPWNNFLHNVVYDVVQQVFNGPMDRGYNRSLAIDLFETGRITDRIIEGQEESDKSQRDTNMRLGYMGHLTLIAEEVLKFTERHPAELLSQFVVDKVVGQPWIDYVEQTLAETRERDNTILGGVRPDMSVGPRQAVLNAVNANTGFGNTSSAGGAGLSNSGALGLDSMDLANTGGTYAASGSALLSGFNNSSDEEDEEMEEGELERERDRQNPSHLGDEDQSSLLNDSQQAPPPLQIPPSRARRQFAARLAQRKAALEAANRERDISTEPSDTFEEGLIASPEEARLDEPKGKESGKGGPERFSNLFSGDSSDEDDEGKGSSKAVTAAETKSA